MEKKNFWDKFSEYLIKENVPLFNQIKEEQREKTLLLEKQEKEEITKEEEERIEEIKQNFVSISKQIRETQKGIEWYEVIDEEEEEESASALLVRYRKDFKKLPQAENMPLKTFKIFLFALSMIYGRKNTVWEIRTEWMERVLGISKINKTDIRRLKLALPYVVEKGKKEFVFNEVKFLNRKYKEPKLRLSFNSDHFKKYFREVQNNFVFFNLEEINKCKTKEEIKLFLFFRENSWSERLGGNSIFVSLEEIRNIMDMRYDYSFEKVEKKFFKAVKDLNQRYSIFPTCFATEFQKSAVDYVKSFDISVSTDIETVSIGKLEFENKLLKKKEYITLLKMIFSSNSFQESKEKKSDLKEKKEKKKKNNKSLSKREKIKVKINSAKENAYIKTEAKQVKQNSKKIKEDSLELKTLTEEEKNNGEETVHYFKGRVVNTFYTPKEQEKMSDVIEVNKNGKIVELGVLKTLHLPSGLDRTKFAIPVSIQKEIVEVSSILDDTSKENRKVSAKEVATWNIQEGIDYIKQVRNLVVNGENEFDLQKRTHFRVYYSYKDGTINSENFINSVLAAKKRFGLSLSRHYIEEEELTQEEREKIEREAEQLQKEKEKLEEQAEEVKDEIDRIYEADERYRDLEDELLENKENSELISKKISEELQKIQMEKVSDLDFEILEEKEKKEEEEEENEEERLKEKVLEFEDKIENRFRSFNYFYSEENLIKQIGKEKAEEIEEKLEKEMDKFIAMKLYEKKYYSIPELKERIVFYQENENNLFDLEKEIQYFSEEFEKEKNKSENLDNKDKEEFPFMIENENFVDEKEDKAIENLKEEIYKFEERSKTEFEGLKGLLEDDLIDDLGEYYMKKLEEEFEEAKTKFENFKLNIEIKYTVSQLEEKLDFYLSKGYKPIWSQEILSNMNKYYKMYENEKVKEN